jgi:hypothetical protein
MTDWCRYYYKKIVLEHNHILVRSPSMTKQMSGHKMKETVVDGMVNIMHKARVSHIKVMHVLHDSVGGPQNLSITERVIQNRYSHCLKSYMQFLCIKMHYGLIEWMAYMRTALIWEEAIDDIRKLQAFFEECKSNNPQFYYKFQVDKNNVVKMCFGAIQASKVNTKVTKKIQFFIHWKWMTITLMKNWWQLQLSVVKMTE